MTKEERSEYQKFATYCMRYKTPVKFGTGAYIVTAVIYRLRDRTKALTPNGKTASKLIREECDRRIDQTAQWLIASMAMVLLDKAHVSSDEIQTIIQEIENLFNGINRNYVTFDDIMNTLKTEYGVNLHFVQKKEDTV